MLTRSMVLGVLVVGSFGQMACYTEADAAQAEQLETAVVSTGEEQARFSRVSSSVPHPGGLVPTDDSHDSGAAEQDGADCGESPGTPAASRRRCRYDHPLLDYISRDPAECATISILCVAGFRPFSNACGCGCKRTGSPCDYNDPNRIYISRSPGECARIQFLCEPERTPFYDACGCGCELAPEP